LAGSGSGGVAYGSARVSDTWQLQPKDPLGRHVQFLAPLELSPEFFKVVSVTTAVLRYLSPGVPDLLGLVRVHAKPAAGSLSNSEATRQVQIFRAHGDGTLMESSGSTANTSSRTATMCRSAHALRRDPSLLARIWRSRNVISARSRQIGHASTLAAI
jgi:hypothetical protein